MNALITLDYYIWKIFILKIKPSWFKSRLLSIAAILYISIFPLSRKFIIHYFRGKGDTVHTSTRDLLLKNPKILQALQDCLGFDRSAHQQELFIGQHLVNHPDHRYAIGSLNLRFRLEEDQLHVSFYSMYHFDSKNERITRALHHWLSSMEKAGSADNFSIEGEPWTLNILEFFSIQIPPHHRKYINYNILYL